MIKFCALSSFYRSDSTFVVSTRAKDEADGCLSVMDTRSKTWIKSTPVQLVVMEMTLVNREIIAAIPNGKVLVYNTELVVITEYDASTPGGILSIAANDKFIAYGNSEGVVRFYVRQGFVREMVGHIFSKLLKYLYCNTNIFQELRTSSTSLHRVNQGRNFV